MISLFYLCFFKFPLLCLFSYIFIIIYFFIFCISTFCNSLFWSWFKPAKWFDLDAIFVEVVVVFSFVNKKSCWWFSQDMSLKATTAANRSGYFCGPVCCLWEQESIPWHELRWLGIYMKCKPRKWCGFFFVALRLA